MLELLNTYVSERYTLRYTLPETTVLWSTSEPFFKDKYFWINKNQVPE